LATAKKKPGVAMLQEAIEKLVREIREEKAKKSAFDKKANRAIGKAEKMLDAAIDELDAIRAGRNDFLPFTDGNWDEGDQDRDPNV
jgi:hypothetical protein